MDNRLSMTDKDLPPATTTTPSTSSIAVDYPLREWDPELSVEEKTNGTMRMKRGRI
jgi:hypothetical protein